MVIHNEVDLITEQLCDLVHRPVGFVKRQERDFKVVISHNALNSFTWQLSLPYESIYIRALGASALQLGFLNTLLMVGRSLFASPTGWLVDRYRLRWIFLSGVGLLIVVPIIYALAVSWWMIAGAMILYALSMRLAYSCCSVVCAGSLDTKDRATGKNFCSVLSSIAKLTAPVLASILVTFFGGLTLQGIRPIYYVQILGYALIFVFMFTQFQGTLHRTPLPRRPMGALVQDFKDVFEGKPRLKRWLLISGLIWMPYAMITPYIPVFAHEFKEADQYTLGLMISAAALIPFVLGIPLGRLADRIGRKKVIYLVTPLFYVSMLILVLAPSPRVLILAGIFQGFYMSLRLLNGTMTSELVPIEQMGRWGGIMGLCRGLFTIPAPFLGGLIWTYLNPAYVFLIPIVLDLCLRIPLFMTIPETLNSEIAKSQTRHLPKVT